MSKLIVSSPDPITIVGGAQCSQAVLDKALNLAPTTVAADGGAQTLFAAGQIPQAVIGDFDSISTVVRQNIPPERLHPVEEQMSTDFEKVLMRVTAPVILGVGFLGGRLDHELAALHGLMAFADKPVILMDETQIVFHAPPRIALPLVAEDLVSLFPLGAVSGQSRGLAWPIEGLDFAPGRKIGTSNAALGPCEIMMDAPGMLIILPARLMPLVVAAILSPDHVQWPARAE